MKAKTELFNLSEKDSLQFMESLFHALQQSADSVSTLQGLRNTLQTMPVSLDCKERLSAVLAQAHSVSERLETHHQNEFGLRAVFESAQALTELKALNSVLFEITERGRHLMGSDLAWVAGANTVDGGLSALAFSGVFSKNFSERQTPENGGVAGHVIKTRSAFSTHDYMADQRFQHTEASDAMIQGEGLLSLVAVPLLSGSEVIGILLVGDRSTRHYLPREISILATLAAHASVAVKNARAFEVTCNALVEAERANAQLLRQASALEFAVDAHEKQTKMLAKGTNIQEMVATVVKILGGTLHYFDAVGSTVCVDSNPADVESQHYNPALDRMKVQLAVGESRISGRSVAVDSSNTLGHVRVSAVLSGDGLHGALLLHTSQPLTEQAIRVLERSTMVIAVLELTAEKKSASQDREISLFVRALIDSHHKLDGDLRARLKTYGLEDQVELGLAIIRIDKSKISFLVRRLRSRFHASAHLITGIDDGVIMIYAQSGSPNLAQDLESILFKEIELEGLVCLSGPHHRLDALHHAYSHTRKVIALAETLGRKNCIIHEASLRMYAILFQGQNQDDIQQTLSAVIGPLIEHDARRQTKLTHTLLAYFNCLQNARNTAKLLHVHVNTLHNRLDLIRTLLGAWEDRIAEVHMALQLHALSQQGMQG